MRLSWVHRLVVDIVEQREGKYRAGEESDPTAEKSWFVNAKFEAESFIFRRGTIELNQQLRIQCLLFPFLS